MPNSEEDKRRREQQSEHITKGRECERHLFSDGRFLAPSQRMMQAVLLI